MRPNVSSAAFAMASVSLWLETSQGTPMTLFRAPPCAFAASAAPAQSAMTTFAPSARRPCTIACPIPIAPPVTITLFPLQRISPYPSTYAHFPPLSRRNPRSRRQSRRPCAPNWSDAKIIYCPASEVRMISEWASDLSEPATPATSCSDLFRASRSARPVGRWANAWMAGTSPAMTCWGFPQCIRTSRSGHYAGSRFMGFSENTR